MCLYDACRQAIGLADSPAISQALTDPSGKHTIFMGRDMAWEALAESLHTTFDAMLVDEKERLQRVSHGGCLGKVPGRLFPLGGWPRFAMALGGQPRFATNMWVKVQGEQRE